MKLRSIALFGINTGTIFLSFVAKGMENNFAALDTWAFTSDDPAAKIAAPTPTPVASTVSATKSTAQTTAKTLPASTQAQSKSPQAVTKSNSEPQPVNTAGYMSEKDYIPHFYLNGYAGGNDEGDYNAIGRFDVLAPIYLRTDRNLFLYGQANIASPQESWENTGYSGSLGIGYRQIINTTNNDTTTSGRILGAYLLVDGNRTPDGNNFTDLSPGIETLGERWDFRANGYIPVGSKDWHTTYWAHDLGDWSNYDQDTTPHTITDNQYVFNEEVGTGADAELGVKLFSINRMPVKAYLDGYYFYMSEHDDMLGVGGRLTFQPTAFLTLEARYTYDNYQMNQFLLGLRINLNELGNYKHVGVDDANMQNRLFDQLERNFASQITGTTASPEIGGPNDTSYKPDDIIDDVVVSDNNWYFADPSTMPEGYSNGDGTHANPYSADEFNQTTVDQIYGDTVSSGQYSSMNIHLESGNAYVISSSNSGDPVLDLPANTYVYGQDDNFEQSEQVTIEGGMTLNTGDGLSYLQFYNDPGYQLNSALTVNSGATNVILNNVVIGDSDGQGNPVGDNYSYATGIVMDNAQVSMSNSSIYAYDKDNETNAEGVVEATGIKMINGGILYLNKTTIDVYASEENSGIDYSGIAYGIHADGFDSEEITVNASSISVSGNGGQENSGNAYGILVGENYDHITDNTDHSISNINLTIANSTITASGFNSSLQGEFSGNGYGVLIGYGAAEWISGSGDGEISNNTILIKNNSSINGNGSGRDTSSGNAYGVAIGYGYNAITNVGSVNAAVTSNTLHIEDSVISVSGLMVGMPTLVYEYAGRGIGVLIGYGQTAVVTNGNDLSITWNEINMNNFTIISNSNNNGQREVTSESPVPNPYQNEDELSYTNVGYGVLVGYGGEFNGNTVNTYGVSHNTLSFVNQDVPNKDSSEKVYVAAMGNGMTAVAGIECGNYNSNDHYNTVTITNILFQADTSLTMGNPDYYYDTQYAVGLYMPEDATSTLNWKDNDGNKNSLFYRYGYAGIAGKSDILAYGYGLLGPNREGFTNANCWGAGGLTPATDLFASIFLDDSNF